MRARDCSVTVASATDDQIVVAFFDQLSTADKPLALLVFSRVAALSLAVEVCSALKMIEEQ
jgi:hypothetical protein